ncbi:MAG: phosphatase PAP2 family protein [Treponema sp.]|jgi:membrane-associated phospholipid phosphatase|nr:phosphatase PAP2 family protein [Treponema sp.]
MDGTIGALSAADPSPLFGVYYWGIAVIKAIQTIESPALTTLMRFLTALGTELLYIPVILFIYWCADTRGGMRLGVLLMVSSWSNSFLKNLLGQPRPYTLDPSVGRGFEASYGIPSGHAQHSLVFWIAAVPLVKKPFLKMPARIAAAFFIPLIAFTRLYLGLHFPTDIFGGWIAGAVLLALYFLFAGRLEALLAGLNPRYRMILAALAAFLINASGVGADQGGLFLGFCCGCGLMNRHIGFAADAPVKDKKPGAAILLARYVLGAAGAVLLYLALKALLPGEESIFADLPLWGAASPYHELGRFLRYGALALWISAGAPWLFCRAGLAERRAGSNSGDNAAARAQDD